MTDERTTIDAAMRNVAASIRVDTAYFAPPEQDRFDPITVTIGLGGLLVGAFCKGFVEQASKHAEDAGRATATWLQDRIDRLFREPESVSVDTARAAAEREVAAARAAAERLDEGVRLRLQVETRYWLELTIGEYGVPEARSAALADVVATQAESLIVQAAGAP
jgi:hypothetical protein